MLNGLKWASAGKDYLRPWTDQYRSIVGGALYIGSGYINVGQNTVYLEKFNVTAKSRYTHQYMTNVAAASEEAANIKKAYAESGLLEKTPLVFSIPVYKNMPKEPCAAPN
jgi:beta-N-acetylglucosaminidase